MTLSVTLIISFSFSWQVSLVVLAITPLQMIGSIVTMRLYKNNNQGNISDIQKSYKKSNALLAELIVNYKTVIGFGGHNIDGIM